MKTDYISLFWAVCNDGFFAAIAALGFAIISNPPRKALLISALLAAIGHGLRYYLMHEPTILLSIAPASLLASFSIGLLAIPFARYVHCPAEIFAFPSLLPMVPGMYAYNTIIALGKFLQSGNDEIAQHYIIAFLRNGTTAVFVMSALVVGVIVPIFIFHRTSFSATRLLRKLRK